jgi:hypothetical protein
MPNSATPIPVLIATPHELALLRESGASSWPQVRRREVGNLVKGLTPADQEYIGPSYYMAWVTAYLQDEGYISDEDFGLSDKVSSPERGIAAVLPRKGAKLQDLDPARLDLARMVREFHGGGSGDDPEARSAFVGALEIIRSALVSADDDGAIVILLNGQNQ